MRRHRVERGNRLVGEDDGGILVERAGERDTLLLAAGELVAADVGLIQNTDLIQRGEGGELLLLVEQAEEHAEEAHIRHHGGQNVLERRRAGDEVEGLEDHADLAAELAQRLAGELGNVRVVHGQFALGDVDHAVDGADQRGFARAGEADDGDEFALLELEVDVLETLDAVGIRFGNVLKFDQKGHFLFAMIGVGWTFGTLSQTLPRDKSLGLPSSFRGGLNRRIYPFIAKR